MDVSENSGIPKSSILIGFSIINHPFWGTPIFGNTHIKIPACWFHLKKKTSWVPFPKLGYARYAQAGTGAVGSTGCRLLQQYVDVSLLLGWLLAGFVGIW